MKRPALALAALAALLWSCSDDGGTTGDGPVVAPEVGIDAGADSAPDSGIGNDVKPEMYAGGGTGGGSIDGRLNVYVVDAADDSPLEGALVMLGDGTTDQGTTDKDGLITFRRAGLAGPVTVTAGITGYATSTVVGLDAANFTLTLGSRTAPAPIKTGTCSGTVKDWASLPALPANHVRIGVAGYLMTKELGGAENEVQQPSGDLNLYSPELSKTTWTVTVPAKDGLGVYVAVLDVDTQGTTTADDDVRTLTHVGVVRDLKVGEGQVLANIQVPLVPADDKIKVNVPSTLPAGTDASAVGLIVQLPTGELLPFFLPTGAGEFPVPKLAGDYAGGSYWVLVSAEPTGSKEGDRQTESLVLKRDITDTSKAVDISMLELPSALKLTGRTLSFSAPPNLQLQSVDLYPEAPGAPHWSVAFIDAASPVSFTLPDLPAGAKAEDLPAGKLFMHVKGMELAGVDLNNARFKELTNSLTRWSQHGALAELK